jgi:hypothetical protein
MDSQKRILGKEGYGGNFSRRKAIVHWASLGGLLLLSSSSSSSSVSPLRRVSTLIFLR